MSVYDAKESTHPWFVFFSFGGVVILHVQNRSWGDISSRGACAVRCAEDRGDRTKKWEKRKSKLIIV